MMMESLTERRNLGDGKHPSEWKSASEVWKQHGAQCLAQVIGGVSDNRFQDSDD